MNKMVISIMALLPLTMTSCFTTLTTISSVQPQTTTIVKMPAQPSTSTTIQVNSVTRDYCLHLDLQAVGAAFAQANSIEEFEYILNSPNYMINNLDLNHDGWIDYLRVMEVVNGRNHFFVIQAVLAPNVYQDVATLAVEMSYSTPYCQVIGNPYIYGKSYVVQPIFVKTPPMYAHFVKHTYSPWRSPYYWDKYPSYYHKPAPMHLSHYQAYVGTYIRNHKYCHEVSYPMAPHCVEYNTYITVVSRSDYQKQHPEYAFERRTSNMTYSDGGTSRVVTNASDVRRVASNSSSTSTVRNSSTRSTSSVSSSTSTSLSTRPTTSTTTATTNSGNRASSSTSTATRAQTTTSSTRASSSSTQPSSTLSNTRTSSSTTSSSSTRSSSPSTTSSTRSSSTSTTGTTRSSSPSNSVGSTSGVSQTTTRVKTDGYSTTTTRSASGVTTTRSSSPSTTNSTRAASTSSASTTRSSSTSATNTTRAASTSSTSTTRSSTSTGSSTTRSTTSTSGSTRR